MIVGIGTDIIEIERIEKAINSNDKFIDKILTKNEKIQLLKKGLKLESVAGRFAAKEAISKALGTGFRSFSFDDIEILSNKVGMPEVMLSDHLKLNLGLPNDLKVKVSISHNKSSAIAFAIVEEC